MLKLSWTTAQMPLTLPIMVTHTQPVMRQTAARLNVSVASVVAAVQFPFKHWPAP